MISLECENFLQHDGAFLQEKLNSRKSNIKFDRLPNSKVRGDKSSFGTKPKKYSVHGYNFLEKVKETGRRPAISA
jgi:hypothetical protein